jgi:hypothetical protein
MPSFQKNAFWGQLSNLDNSGDAVFGTATNNAYLLGGQMDVMGMGRAGTMFDWYGQTSSTTAINKNGTTNAGLSESTWVDYRDTDSDGVYDYKAETYSHVKRVNPTNSNELYLAYGLGGIMGMDLGLGVRGYWSGASPSYAPMAGGYGTVGYTFDETTRIRQYNMLSGAEQLRIDRTSTGSLEYGDANWRLLLGGRAKDVIPGLDLVANLGPILRVNYNKLKAEATDIADLAPNQPVVSTQTVTNKLNGIDTSVAKPGSGIGVQADVRGDYNLTANIVLMGSLGYITQPETLASDAKLEQSSASLTQSTVGANLQVTDINNVDTYAYDGKLNDSIVAAKVRAQFLAKNWKLGLGINYSNQFTDSSVTTKYEQNYQTRVSGTGNPATDTVATTTGKIETLTKSEIADTKIDFPIGVVFNLIDVLPIRFGAKHQVWFRNVSSSTETNSRTPFVTRTVDGNGGVTTSVPNIVNSQDEVSGSSFNVTHTNTFYYGLSWWPYQDVQIDFTGFGSNILALSNYNLSFNFYF